MASSLTSYMAAKLTDGTLRGQTFTAPPKVFVALFTGAPGPGAGGPEASYTGYARQEGVFGEADGNGTALNTAKIEFPENTGVTTQTATHLAIFDALAGGNKMFVGQLTSPKVIEPDDYVAFGVGTLSSTLEVTP